MVPNIIAIFFLGIITIGVLVFLMFLATQVRIFLYRRVIKKQLIELGASPKQIAWQLDLDIPYHSAIYFFGKEFKGR